MYNTLRYVSQISNNFRKENFLSGTAFGNLLVPTQHRFDDHVDLVIRWLWILIEELAPSFFIKLARQNEPLGRVSCCSPVPPLRLASVIALRQGSGSFCAGHDFSYTNGSHAE